MGGEVAKWAMDKQKHNRNIMLVVSVLKSILSNSCRLSASSCRPEDVKMPRLLFRIWVWDADWRCTQNEEVTLGLKIIYCLCFVVEVCRCQS